MTKLKLHGNTMNQLQEKFIHINVSVYGEKKLLGLLGQQTKDKTQKVIF